MVSLIAQFPTHTINSSSHLAVSNSPATFETPLLHAEHKDPASVRSSKSTSSEPTSLSKKHSLDSFLHNFTSEDNNSFSEIIEKADQKLKQKFSVLFEAEQKMALEMAQSLALPPIERQFEAVEGPKRVDMWTYKNKNYVMYVPEGVQFTREEQLEMARNRQEVVHSNTRLIQSPWDEQKSRQAIAQAAKNQSKVLSGKIGVDGSVQEASVTPQVRGFRFERTPSPSPGVAESPLMTWGEIEGTPFRLDGGDTPLRPAAAGPSFRIAEASRRETIGLKLAEKAGERMRGQKAKAMEAARRNIASPYIRSSLDRLASMSPAARRLATSKRAASIMTPVQSHALGTFTPGSSRSHRATPSPLVLRKSGPQTPAKAQQRPAVEVTSDLTSDLLNLPPPGKRNQASDFF